MRKHKNLRQEKMFLIFMQANPNFAKGYIKRDRAQTDSLWNDLARILNCEGPPQKDATGWKKVFHDWKSYIRKKIEHNKKEKDKPEGIPHNILPISTIEDSIAKVTGLYGQLEFDIRTTPNKNNLTSAFSSKNVIPTITNIVEDSESETLDNLNNVEVKVENEIVMDPLYPEKPIETDQLENISVKINETIELQKENKNELKRTYSAIEKLCDILNEGYIEKKRHHLEMERIAEERNEIKGRLLEIEEAKFNMALRNSKKEKAVITHNNI